MISFTSLLYSSEYSTCVSPLVHLHSNDKLSSEIEETDSPVRKKRLSLETENQDSIQSTSLLRNKVVEKAVHNRVSSSKDNTKIIENKFGKATLKQATNKARTLVSPRKSLGKLAGSKLLSKKGKMNQKTKSNLQITHEEKSNDLFNNGLEQETAKSRVLSKRDAKSMNSTCDFQTSRKDRLLQWRQNKTQSEKNLNGRQPDSKENRSNTKNTTQSAKEDMERGKIRKIQTQKVGYASPQFHTAS